MGIFYDFISDAFGSNKTIVILRWFPFAWVSWRLFKYSFVFRFFSDTKWLRALLDSFINLAYFAKSSMILKFAFKKIVFLSVVKIAIFTDQGLQTFVVCIFRKFLSILSDNKQWVKRRSCRILSCLCRKFLCLNILIKWTDFDLRILLISSKVWFPISCCFILFFIFPYRFLLSAGFL